MRSGFFNSDITGYDSEGMPIFDRAEDAEFFALFYHAFFTNGVFPNPSTNFQVEVSEGMTVKVNPGICFVEGYFGLEDAARVLSVQACESLDRIDRVVLRLNLADRKIDLYVVKGVAATKPVAPVLTRPQPNQGGDIYELGIADVFVAKNTTSITQQRITDLRLNSELCGIITQTIDGIDTSTLFIQLQDQITRNIELIQSALDDTLAGQIINMLIKDVGKVIVPASSIWTQLTTVTATVEELENDPSLEFAWYTDFVFNCLESDDIDLRPNIPTGNLGLAPSAKTLNGKIRFYAGANLNGSELKFMHSTKRKGNTV